MDVAIAREVFTFLCDMGRRFHASSAEMERWNAILQKLPAYRINNDGALAEWVDPAYPDIYNHRHNSHLYPVFPGRMPILHCRRRQKWRWTNVSDLIQVLLTV